MERNMLGAVLVIASLSLARCEVPPGCGPVSPGTGGWRVQCDGMASLHETLAMLTLVAEPSPLRRKP